MSDVDIRPNDWIRCYRDGVLKILEVRYVRRNRTGELLVYTDDGQLGLRQVFEVRRLAEYIRGDSDD